LAGIAGAIEALRVNADAFERDREAAVARADAEALRIANRRLIQFERAFLSTGGIPGRPWYRHLIYAPKYTYAPEVFPGVSEALDAKDPARAANQAQALSAAIRRAAEVLRE
jgi:N-acetylated-alpha-linked acidic dipeptidase